MAEYINFPVDFFDREPIKSIDEEGTVLLYIHLLCQSYKNGKGTFTIGSTILTDDTLKCIFCYENIGEKIDVLQRYGLIKRNEKSIQVFKFWIDAHDRNSSRYKEWRKAVFERDGFHCVKCGTKKDLQAHHIKPWKNNKALRYEVSNGVLLCRKCHLKEHKGCWRNV